MCEALSSSHAATLLVESLIGGRMISTYKLDPPIACPDSGFSVPALEIPAPKKSSFYKSGLEHVEFAMSDISRHSPENSPSHKGSLLSFASCHSTVPFDFGAADKDVNPDISLELAGLEYATDDPSTLSRLPSIATVKFHLCPLSDVVAWEIAHGVALSPPPPPPPPHEPKITASWEREIAKRVAKTVAERKGDKPYVVGIVGIPGAGKTTSSGLLKSILLNDFSLNSFVLPMDGYHTSLANLDSSLVYFRGCPASFEAATFKRDLASLASAPLTSSSSSSPRLSFPGFDHAIGDPAPNVHVYLGESVVIVEGLYLLLSDWDCRSLFDETVFIDADIDEAIERLKIRNRCIPGYTVEQIETRCDEVDRANAVRVTLDKDKASCVVACAIGVAATTTTTKSDKGSETEC